MTDISLAAIWKEFAVDIISVSAMIVLAALLSFLTKKIIRLFGEEFLIKFERFHVRTIFIALGYFIILATLFLIFRTTLFYANEALGILVSNFSKLKVLL